MPHFLLLTSFSATIHSNRSHGLDLGWPTAVSRLADYKAGVNAARPYSFLIVDINICMRDAGALLLLKQRRRDKRRNPTAVY